jgi:hypothetical protein
MKNRFKINLTTLAVLLMLSLNQSANAAITDAQLPFSADPYQKWQGWQAGTAAETVKVFDFGVKTHEF